MIYVAPSLLSANFVNLEKEIELMENSKADYIHLDIMDGKFVPNITFGPLIVKACKKYSNLKLDVHLMIDNPENYIQDFIDAGADIISLHVESTTHIHRHIQFIQSQGVKAAVALNPSTSLDCLTYLIDDLDMVLLMSVNPGFSGQKFIPAIIDKIIEFNKRFKNRLKKDFLLQVDGGVNDKTCKQLTSIGVNMLVSGSYFFQHENPKKAIEILKS